MKGCGYEPGSRKTTKMISRAKIMKNKTLFFYNTKPTPKKGTCNSKYQVVP